MQKQMKKLLINNYEIIVSPVSRVFELFLEAREACNLLSDARTVRIMRLRTHMTDPLSLYFIAYELYYNDNHLS